MSKPIRISDEAYELLSELSIGFETPSEVIKRVCELHKKVTRLPVWTGVCTCTSTSSQEGFDKHFGYVNTCCSCSRIYRRGY